MKKNITIIRTIQESLNSNAAKVEAWNEAHTESTYTQSKTVLRWMWIFITTSVKIWLRALFKGKMSWKNIGIVLGTSIPLILLGGLLGAIYAPLGAPLVFLGNFILMATILLLLPRWMIPIILWLVALNFAIGSEKSTTTVNRYYGDYDSDACCGAGSYEEHVAGGGNR